MQYFIILKGWVYKKKSDAILGNWLLYSSNNATILKKMHKRGRIKCGSRGFAVKYLA